MCRHERPPLLLWETKLKLKYVCSSTLFPLLNQLANFNCTQGAGCLKNCICGYAGSQHWIIAPAATGQRRFLHWVSSPPVPPREDWEGWVWEWAGRSCGLAGMSPGVFLQAAQQVLSTAAHPASALLCCCALALPRGSLLRLERPSLKIQ